MTFAHRRAIVRQRPFDLVTPVAVLCLDDKFASPGLLVLGGTENHFNGSTFPSKRFQFSVLRYYCEVDARLRAEVCPELGVIFYSVGELKLHTRRFIDGCHYLKPVVRGRCQED